MPYYGENNGNDYQVRMFFITGNMIDYGFLQGKRGKHGFLQGKRGKHGFLQGKRGKHGFSNDYQWIVSIF